MRVWKVVASTAFSFFCLIGLGSSPSSASSSSRPRSNRAEHNRSSRGKNRREATARGRERGRGSRKGSSDRYARRESRRDRGREGRYASRDRRSLRFERAGRAGRDRYAADRRGGRRGRYDRYESRYDRRHRSRRERRYEARYERSRDRRTRYYQPEERTPSARTLSGIPSDRVTEIQKALIRAGYLTGDPSGQYDSATTAAMKQFQAGNGFHATGLPSAEALKKLGVSKRSNDGYATPINGGLEGGRKPEIRVPPGSSPAGSGVKPSGSEPRPELSKNDDHKD